MMYDITSMVDIWKSQVRQILMMYNIISRAEIVSCDITSMIAIRKSQVRQILMTYDVTSRTEIDDV
jgi:hypothetical protein